MRRAQRYATAVGLVSGAAVLWVVWPRERLLLDRATKIASTKGWRAQNYLWVSDHELIHFRTGTAVAATRRNVDTGTETPMPSLSAAMAREWCSHRIPPEAWDTVSPDGRWILARDWGSAPDNEAALLIDGTQVVRGRSRWNSVGRWLPDSSGWVDLERASPGAYQAVVHRTLRGTTVSRPISGMGFVGIAQGCLVDGTLAVAEDKEIDSWLHRGPARWYTVPLDGGPAVQHLTPLPPGPLKYYFVSAPRGDRILWVIVCRRPLSQLQRILSGLWSVGDGAEIGHVFFADTSPGAASGRLGSIHWTPDSKKVSFLYKDALYTIPAD